MPVREQEMPIVEPAWPGLHPCRSRMPLPMYRSLILPPVMTSIDLAVGMSGKGKTEYSQLQPVTLRGATILFSNDHLPSVTALRRGRECKYPPRCSGCCPPQYRTLRHQFQWHSDIWIETCRSRDDLFHVEPGFATTFASIRPTQPLRHGPFVKPIVANPA